MTTLLRSEVVILDVVAAFEGTQLATIKEMDNRQAVKSLIRRDYLAVEKGNLIVTAKGDIARGDTNFGFSPGSDC